MAMLSHPGVGLVEYRRAAGGPGALAVECRILRPDGRPYDGAWYPVTPEALDALSRDGAGRDLIRRMWAEADPAAPPDVPPEAGAIGGEVD